MERNDYLVKKKVKKYILTGVMTSVSLQLGNVVDAIIVGNLLGSMGNGAVSAGTPYVYLLQAAALLFGSGGAVTMAVLLGRRDTESAGRVMGLCILASICYPLVFTLLTPVLVPAFVGITGASGELAGMIRQLATVYSIGMPVISFMIVMAYLMNVDNHPAMSANLHITANVVNLVFDFILVKYTPLGITGAALSTVLGYIAAGVIFLPRYMRSPNRMVSPVFKGISHHKDLIRMTCKNGFPNLVTLVMTVISVAIINTSVVRSLGAAYFSAYAVANNTQLIVQMFLNGISSVIASVAGFFYGEKDYYGMRSVIRRVLKAALLTGAVIMVLFLAAPQLIAGMYGFDNASIRPELLTGLRLFSLSFGFFILNAITQNYYRTIGQTMLSTGSSVLEMLVFKVPFMLIAMKCFGFIGLFGAIIVSEFLSLAVIHLIRALLQKAGKVPQKGFMAIPEKNTDNICDVSIIGSDAEAVRISEQIMEYCRKEQMPSGKAEALAIAAEEITANIGRYGYKDPNDRYIDVCLSKTGDSYFLRFRDDGIPFDPVAYQPKEHDPYDIRGLELIRKMAVKMKYVRAISLNNTIIEVDISK